MTWKKPSGFVWAMMGSAIGFANLLSFGAQCYKNGGGAFLIPFVAAMLLLGLPMLILEGTIGHKMRLPIVSAFGQVAGRPYKIFGWLSVIAVATIGAFYVVLTGYSLAYTYFAGAGTIPSDTATFFKETFLHSSPLGEMGTFSWSAFIAMAASTLFAGYVLARNIRKGVEKLCSIFLPLLCGIVTLLALITLFLPGAMNGIAAYLIPDFSQLANASLWRDVFGQVFFSFSLGLGIVTAYSRHTKSEMSIARAMWYVALGDLAVSLIAGFALFGCVGYLSHTTGAPFASIVTSESSFEMGFVIFPKILQAFPAGISQVVGVIFFASVFVAGITGVFSIMESIMGNIQIEFNRSRRTAAIITTTLLTAAATLFCFGNGQAIIGALAPMVLGNNMLIGGLAEVAIFLYLTRTILDEPIWQAKPITLKLLRTFVPLTLAMILATSLRQEFSQTFGAGEWIRWSWFAVAILLSATFSLRSTKSLIAIPS